MLGPSGNVQGAHKFLLLTTMKVITRRAWNLLPMPTGVIERVHMIARDQPSLLTFTDLQGHEIGDTDPIFHHPSTMHDEVDIPGVIRDAVDILGVDDPPCTNAADGGSDGPALGNDVNVTPNITPTKLWIDEQPVVFEPTIDLNEHASAPPGEHVQESAPLPVVTGTPPWQSSRVRTPLERYKYSYATMYLSLRELALSQEFDEQVVELVMTQLSLN